MEVLLAIGSLLGAGYYLNPEKQKRDASYKTPQQNTGEPNGSNIYNSRDYYKVHEQEASKMVDNWEASKNPLSTNVIPHYFNTIYLKDKNVEKVSNPNYNKDMIYSVLDSFDVKTKQLLAAKKCQTVKKIVNDSERSTENEWGMVSGRPSSDRLDHNEGKLSQIGGSLLPNRGYEDFTHNNMVPFYGGSLTQSMDMDNRMGAQKLEAYTGQFKLNRQQKEEVGNLFSPAMGATNIHGHETAASRRDMSRYFTRARNNDTPWDKVYVGPGLNKGFTAAPSGGFHNRVRIMPKPTEQTRIDPVFEQEGRINPGKNRVDNRPLIQQMYKNVPELLVTNKNGERNFTTVGAVRGRKIRPNVLVRDTNRKKSRMLMNPAKMVSSSKSYIPPKSKVSRRLNFLNTPHRNAVRAEGKRVNDHGKGSYRNRLNERAVTGTRRHVLNPMSWVKALTSCFTDSAKKTRKQHYINHPRSRGNVKAQRPSALPAYDPRQVLKTTIRETTENNRHKGYVGSYKKQRAYDPSQRARATIRETTEDLDRKGIAGSSWKKQKAYDPRQVARTTIRETTENKKHQGWVKHLEGKGPIHNTCIEAAPRTTVKETTIENKYLGHVLGERRKHVTYDPSQRTRTTIRETTEDNKHKGNVASLQKKHIAYDPKEKARTTIRETTEDNKHLGNAGSTLKKQKAYNTTEKARITIRETTEDNKHIGGANRRSLQSGKGYYTTDWKANNTNRQFTTDYEYTGVANSNNKKTISYDSGYNARVNTEKENVARGRKPGRQGIKVCNGPSQINIEMKKIDTDRNSIRSATKTSSIGNYYNPQAVAYCTNTSEKNHLPQYDTRFDTSLLDAYKCNPLTQSLNSYY